MCGRLNAQGDFRIVRKNSNEYVNIQIMQYTIEYYSDAVQTEVMGLPATLGARYIVLTKRKLVCGPHLGEPHTKALGDGLLEIRLKGAEGIARVMFCTLIGRKIVVLHSFIKKTDKIPTTDMALSRKRLKEIKNANA
jgi:phage-related protein